MIRFVTIAFLLQSVFVSVDAFTLSSPIHETTIGQRHHLPGSSLAYGEGTSTALRATVNTNVRRRRELLSRNGPYFKMDRFQGDVEFGSSAKLLTKLDSKPNPEGIKEWLSDGRGLALSIWDEDLMKELGNSVYRLQVMKLQFVTIQLAPRVDVKMWTQQDADGEPVFSLQSISFDPNIQVLPGVGVPASALGIEIEVVGELRPSKDGTGVTGAISFATKGILPPPMRLLPEPVLKLSSDTINESIVKLASQSFQQGATKKYREFQERQRKSVNA